MISEKNFNNLTKTLGLALLILLIYSFDYALGWGMNLMFPNIYFFTIGSGNSGYHPFMWNENGIIETIQIVILFLTIILLVQILINKQKSKKIKQFVLLSFFGVSYIFLEEISWGQHFFHFESPNILTNENSLLFNKQGEFNLHNISNLFNEIPRSLILIWCSLSIPLLKIMKFNKNHNFKLIIQPNKNLAYLSYTILLISLPDLIINKLDLINNSKLFIFDSNGFVKYDLYQLIMSTVSFNFIRFSELQELLFFYYFLSHSFFLKKVLLNK